MKIFVADDSKIIRQKIAVLLSESPGVETIGEAGRADDALASIRRLKPDVVILDIKMPGGNGIDIIRPIKKMLPDVVIIMVTNYPYRQYKKMCLEKGADYFLDKSTEFKKIPDILGRLRLSSSQKGTRK
jgi:DNA-binding NarL/FixJ family response regulator